MLSIRSSLVEHRRCEANPIKPVYFISRFSAGQCFQTVMPRRAFVEVMVDVRQIKGFYPISHVTAQAIRKRGQCCEDRGCRHRRTYVRLAAVRS
jgi:hypothetical protein